MSRGSFAAAIRRCGIVVVTGAMVGLLPGRAIALTPPAFIVPDLSASGGVLPLDDKPGDFDGDGKTDIVVANDGPASVFQGGVSVLRGDGAGRLSEPVTTALPADWGARDLAVGDFNGDGKDDVAAIGSTTGGPGPIFSLTSNGNGTFTVAQQLSNTQEGQVVAADFDTDGKVDLAFASRTPTS